MQRLRGKKERTRVDKPFYDWQKVYVPVCVACYVTLKGKHHLKESVVKKKNKKRAKTSHFAYCS